MAQLAWNPHRMLVLAALVAMHLPLASYAVSMTIDATDSVVASAVKSRTSAKTKSTGQTDVYLEQCKVVFDPPQHVEVGASLKQMCTLFMADSPNAKITRDEWLQFKRHWTIKPVIELFEQMPAVKKWGAEAVRGDTAAIFDQPTPFETLFKHIADKKKKAEYIDYDDLAAFMNKSHSDEGLQQLKRAMETILDRLIDRMVASQNKPGERKYCYRDTSIACNNFWAQWKTECEYEASCDHDAGKCVCSFGMCASDGKCVKERTAAPPVAAKGQSTTFTAEQLHVFFDFFDKKNDKISKDELTDFITARHIGASSGVYELSDNFDMIDKDGDAALSFVELLVDDASIRDKILGYVSGL